MLGRPWCSSPAHGPAQGRKRRAATRSRSRGRGTRVTHLQEAEELNLVVFLFLEGDGDMWLQRSPTPALPRAVPSPAQPLGDSILHPAHLLVPHTGTGESEAQGETGGQDDKNGH